MRGCGDHAAAAPARSILPASVCVVVTGAAVHVVHAEYYHVYGCKKPPTSRVGSRLPRGAGVGGLRQITLHMNLGNTACV